MWVVAQSSGCDGNSRTELNYFSTKEIALEFAIEALGNIRTKYGFPKNEYGPMKGSKNFEKIVTYLKEKYGWCGNGMHADDNFGIEISEVPTEPEK